MTPVRRRRRGGRIEEEHQALRPPIHETEPSDLTPTSRPNAILDLQQRYGNAYVNRRMAERGTIQRGPTPRVKEQPRTHKWEYEENHKGRASLHRTTKIESDRWGEIGPNPPRIKYRREVNLRTADGAEVYVDIRGIVRLQPGTTLPDTPEAALNISGLAVETQLSFVVEGGDFETFRDYQPRQHRGLSLMKLTEIVLPDYAKLPLNPAQQEKAILDYLSGLKKRKKEKLPEPSKEPSTAVKVADTVTDFIPIIGELKDAYRAITGVDPVTGEKLKWWERILSGIFAIPFLGKLFKYVGKGLKWVVKGLGWVGRKLGRFLGPYALRVLEWFMEKIAPKRTKQLPPGGGTTGKQAGKAAAKQLTHVKEIFENPAVLAGKTPDDVAHMFPSTHWDKADSTGRSTGTKFTIKNEAGNVTGDIQVRWSKAETGRHFRDATGKGQPYWQISVGNGKPPHVWIGPDGKMYSKPPTYKGGAINAADPAVEFTGSIPIPAKVAALLGI